MPTCANIHAMLRNHKNYKTSGVQMSYDFNLSVTLRVVLSRFLDYALGR